MGWDVASVVGLGAGRWEGTWQVVEPETAADCGWYCTVLGLVRFIEVLMTQRAQ